MQHPFIVGSKIYLRGLEEQDLTGNYYQWFNDSEVCRYNSHGIYPNNIHKMKSYLEGIYTDNTLLVLAIITKENNTHIGNISLQNIDWFHRNAEYAIILGEKTHWGKGYAKEASLLILNHGFNTMNLHRIYCGTADNNLGMQKLATYMKMTKEGIRRQAMYKNGAYRDMLEYGVLKTEFLI